LVSQYATGAGFGLSAYFPVNQHFSIGLMGGYYTFGQNVYVNDALSSETIVENSTENTQMVEVMLSAKYHFSAKGIKPFAFAGVGIADTSTSGTQAEGPSGYAPEVQTITFPSVVCPMLAVGFGLDFQTGKNMNIFIQGKESIVLMPATPLTYISPGDTDTVTVGGAIPYSVFEVGISFDVK
jgi:hypothetical protein